MSKAIISTTECGDPQTTTHRQEVTRLSMFDPPLTTSERLSKTLQYINNPEQYLVDTLGNTAYQERRPLFCISPSYEKDVYGHGKQKSVFEQHIASLHGKKHGLFYITGVQAQLNALRIHCDNAKNPRVAWHGTAHLENAEEHAFEELYNLERILIGDPDRLPTVKEIIETASLPHDQKPAVILIELPNRSLGCATYTFDELVQISTSCRQHGVLLHLDGARLWEIEPYYQKTAGKTFSDIAGLFDSVYVSFYKGLGGITGAMLLTDELDILNKAKMWQRRAGGNPFTLMYETIDCERGFNENIGTFSEKFNKMDEVVRAIQAATSSYKYTDGSLIIDFKTREATCCQILTVFNGYNKKQLYNARDRTEATTGIRIFDMLKPKFTLDDKLAADRDGRTIEDPKPAPGEIEEHEFEWMIMSVTQKLDTAIFVRGYVQLCQELKNGES